MAYRLTIEARATKALEKLPTELAKRIYQQIKGLARDPQPVGVLKLQDSKVTGWRIRCGKHRIIYLIDDSANQVTILQIVTRDKAYKRRG